MIYILIAVILPTIILISGIIFMASGEKLNKRFSSKLMTLRVVFQAIAILILLAAYFFSKNSGLY